MKHIGMELIDVLPGKVSAALEVKAFHKQQHYFLHGGVIGTMADVVMGFAAYSLIQEGQGVVTSSINVQYIKLQNIGEVPKLGPFIVLRDNKVTGAGLEL